MVLNHKKKDGVLQLLAEQGEIDPITQEATLGYMERHDRCSMRALLETYQLSETQLADKIGQYLRVSRIIDLKLENIDVAYLSKIPFSLAKEHLVIVLGDDELNYGKISVVMADPTRTDIIEEISTLIGQPLSLAVAEKTEIQRMINNAYPLELQLPSLFSS